LLADVTTLLGLGSSAPSVSINFSGDEENLSLTVTGGRIDSGLELPLVGTATGPVATPTGGSATAIFWSWRINLNLEDAGPFFVDDEISINGHVQHEIGPHPDDTTQGPQLNFNVVAPAPLTIPSFTASAVGGLSALPHPGRNPPHQDELTMVNLTGTSRQIDDIFGLPFDRTVTGFTFQVIARHVPEPAAVVLVACGLCVMWGASAMRRAMTGRAGDA
jgi:hypothetical protein